MQVRCTGEGNRRDGCGELINIRQEDLYFTRMNVRGHIHYYTTFRCPKCGAETDVAVSGFAREQISQRGERQRAEVSA